MISWAGDPQKLTAFIKPTLVGYIVHHSLLPAGYHKNGLLIRHSVKWLGASANIYLSLYASATSKLMSLSCHLAVGTFCMNNKIPWKSFFCSNSDFQRLRKAAQTYKWNLLNPSGSARYVSHNLMVAFRGNSLRRRLFIHLKLNWRYCTSWPTMWLWSFKSTRFRSSSNCRILTWIPGCAKV